MRTTLFGLIAGLGCLGLGGESATAAQWHGHYGHHHHGHGHYGWGGHYYGGYGGLYGGWGYARPYGGYWHDTSHWDYHPPTLYPHGNHFHYQPGHYDWHYDGHWDHW